MFIGICMCINLLVHVCVYAFLSVCVCARTSRIPRRATTEPRDLKKIQRDAHDPRTTDPQKFSALRVIWTK